MWKTLNSETLIEDYHLTVHKNSVQLNNGSVIEDFYTVTIPDASMICALTPDGKVLLKTEYRYACNDEVIECPAGMFNQDETDPLIVAKRELLEETGYESSDWTYLGSTYESTSKLTNKMHLFLAKECVKTSSQNLDINEIIDVKVIDLKTAVEMVMNGTIKANSTAHLILKVDKLLNH